MEIDYSSLITDLAHGEVNQQLGEQLTRVIEAVKTTGKPGAFTVKLAVSMDSGMCIVKASAVAKTPQKPLEGTMFFFDPKRGLNLNNPRQLELKTLAPPKIVDMPKAPDRKTVAAGEREDG